MVIRRGALALACVAALASSTLLAQQKQTEPQNTRKLNDAQKKEYVALQKIVDDAVAGKMACVSITENLASMRTGKTASS